MASRHDIAVRQTSLGPMEIVPEEDVLYPESDGRPMGESEVHIREMMRLFQMLDQHFALDANVYVGADLMMYYERGNIGAVVAPDVMVSMGVPKSPSRTSYRVWEEPGPPTFVIEVTSKSSRETDRALKPYVYARLGVREYVLYDPTHDYLNPIVQGFRFVDGVPVEMTPDAEGALDCAGVGLRLRLIDGRLRFIDSRTGTLLLDPIERADAEAEARRQAEARIAELEAQIARLTDEAAES